MFTILSLVVCSYSQWKVLFAYWDFPGGRSQAPADRIKDCITHRHWQWVQSFWVWVTPPTAAAVTDRIVNLQLMLLTQNTHTQTHTALSSLRLTELSNILSHFQIKPQKTRDEETRTKGRRTPFRPTQRDYGAEEKASFPQTGNVAALFRLCILDQKYGHRMRVLAVYESKSWNRKIAIKCRTFELLRQIG